MCVDSFLQIYVSWFLVQLFVSFLPKKPYGLHPRNLTTHLWKMIVDYFPFRKVLGGQVVKLATSHRNLHETWKRWCPSSPSFQVQLNMPSPKKKYVQFDDLISFGDINSPMFICGPPPNFFVGWPKRSYSPCCLSPPSSTSGQPWKVSGWQRLGFVWFLGRWAWVLGRRCVCFCFSVAPRKSRPLGNLVHHP